MSHRSTWLLLLLHHHHHHHHRRDPSPSSSSSSAAARVFFQCKIQSLYKNMELYSAFCYSGVLLQTCPDVHCSETGVQRSETGVRRSETVGCAV
ncbi:hypothetical protein PGIGA_G00221500 [Pangasianodon gigas]|uniref:Uncharacterized protein n=1 Tax=Pangasianodon gigas TaxID=30993 RepID=A0ACC5WIL7_PANGG|nr:hypothetical protein [Pangasianodon gigas]